MIGVLKTKITATAAIFLIETKILLI